MFKGLNQNPSNNPHMLLPGLTPQPNYRGPVKLSVYEVKWRDRQPFLESMGYMLRPRLRPGWTPSWISAGKHYEFFEDSARLPLRPLLVDATRISDDKLVYIKEVKTGDLESRIALALSEIEDPTNHSVPILDTFVDSVDKSISYLVMPFLRMSDDPPFGVVEEVVDFADQVLEGLAFMHSRGVAHRDTSLKNILMDASRMFPHGFHPVRDSFLPHDLSTPAPMIPRLNVGVKYCFVDYGISSYFPEGTERQLVLGLAGRERDVPELSDEVPYDPFKVDIFTIGGVLRREFVAKYSNLGFFIPLTEAMTQSDPSRRPSAEHALQQWRIIRGRINFLHRFWRLRHRGESLWSLSLLDILHTLLSIPHFARLLGRGLRLMFARIRL
ncbi:kinase-like domain-containing protein [Lactarius psammicola]|nr:kinase-like domain-containing protein [Lactarius psammicola]